MEMTWGKVEEDYTTMWYFLPTLQFKRNSGLIDVKFNLNPNPCSGHETL